MSRPPNSLHRPWRIAMGVLLVHGCVLGLIAQGWTEPATRSDTHGQAPPVQWVTPLAPAPVAQRPPEQPTAAPPRVATHTPPVLASSQVPVVSQAPPSQAQAQVQAPAEAAPTPVTAGAGAGVAPPPVVQWPSGQDYQAQNPRPPYPALSKRWGEQGQVRVRVWVSADGRASQGGIAQSSGHRRLDEAALNTVLRWRFSPGMVNGLEQPMWVEVPVEFVLE